MELRYYTNNAYDTVTVNHPNGKGIAASWQATAETLREFLAGNADDWGTGQDDDYDATGDTLIATMACDNTLMVHDPTAWEDRLDFHNLSAEGRRAWFRGLRTQASLTQAAAAQIIGVTIAAVEHWEQGRRSVPQYAINALLR